MNGWRTQIRCYVSPGGNNKIADWYAGLSVQAKADADEFLKDMRQSRDWKPPNYRPRLRDLKGVGELRWFSEGKQHRLLGFFREGSWCAVVGCTHKQNVYDPSDAPSTAKSYKGQIERGEAITVEYDL